MRTTSHDAREISKDDSLQSYKSHKEAVVMEKKGGFSYQSDNVKVFSAVDLNSTRKMAVAINRFPERGRKRRALNTIYLRTANTSPSQVGTPYMVTILYLTLILYVKFMYFILLALPLSLALISSP